MALLIEKGIVSPDVNVLAHVSPDDVRGKDVIGVLPLGLAAIAASVTEIPLAIAPEMRGKELDLDTLRGIAGEPVTYRIEIIG